MELRRDIKLSDREFARLADFISSALGIRMPDAKRTMLEVRLGSRVRALGLSSFEEYCEHVFDSGVGSDELRNLIDAVTTNKTEFFREASHFDWLTSNALPDIMRNDPAAGVSRPLRVWSAGCSSGEEAYTLAMVLAEHTTERGRLHFEITATDLSTKVLEAALKAVYRSEVASQVPPAMRHKYLLKSRDREQGLVRVAPAIRRKVKFGRLNLMEPYRFAQPFDVIFCRNVLIYFDRATQTRILQQMCEALTSHGYLFVGHSETLHSMDLPLRYIAPTIYTRGCGE